MLSDTAATSLRDQALAALQAQDPAVQVDFTLAVAPNGLPTGNGSEYALLQDAKAKGVKVSVVNIMTMDFGAGSNDLADAESAAQGDRGPAREPVRDLHLGRLRHDGPDAHRRHQRRRHRLLHLERPVAGELRRRPTASRSCPSGRSTATTRGPATSTRRSSTRSPASSGGGGAGGTARPGRSPGTRACAWTTARPAPPTSTRSRSTPATGPTRSSWTVNSNGTLRSSASAWTSPAPARPTAPLVDLYPCNGTGAQSWVHQSNGELVNSNSGKCLDDTGFGGSGTQVQIWACADSSNQQWNIP